MYYELNTKRTKLNANQHSILELNAGLSFELTKTFDR
jgi:hypothetical protein